MIKVLVPDMPSADELLPYLRRMDERRTYTNRGLLVMELEEQLSKLCGGLHVVTVSSGTAALELTLRALFGEQAKQCYCSVCMPALTFCATGLAARNAGLDVILSDVGNDLQLLPEPSFVDVIMPVATFGRPVKVYKWENYGVPVVIDAAGAFPMQAVSADPNMAVCFSMHATKFVGCGEGGFVVSANADLIASVRSLSLFGDGGTNAKLSEYHAAVALASLDRMSRKMDRTHDLNNWYAECQDEIEFYPTSFNGNTLKVVVLPEGKSAEKIRKKLRACGIEAKQWYRPWLDEHPEFGAGNFPVTNNLRDRLLGIPFHLQLTRQDVAYVMEKLKETLNED